MGGVLAVFVRRPSGMVCDGWIFAVYCVRLLGIIGEMVELLVRFYDAIVRHTLCFFFCRFYAAIVRHIYDGSRLGRI